MTTNIPNTDTNGKISPESANTSIKSPIGPPTTEINLPTPKKQIAILERIAKNFTASNVMALVAIIVSLFVYWQTDSMNTDTKLTNSETRAFNKVQSSFIDKQITKMAKDANELKQNSDETARL